jgi:hypothetical protein
VRTYRYVGPSSILERVAGEPPGAPIRAAPDLMAWMRAHAPRGGVVVATFTVSEDGVLTLADRHSEHVACAGRAPVRAAGEITLGVGPPLEVLAVTHQSTGYCPEPSSWEAVRLALDAAGLPHPGAFARAYTFRRCTGCGQIHVLKEEEPDCAVCGRPLPPAWNLAGLDR